MKKTIFITFVLFLLLTTLSFAALPSLGIFKQNDCIQLKQTCADCTFVNFTRVSYPDSTKALTNVAAEKDGSLFNYSFCNTTQLGSYNVEGIGDTGGVNTIFIYNFDVTTNGKEPAEGIIVVVFSLIFISIIVFGIVYFLKCLAKVIEFDMDIIDTAIMMSTYFAMWAFYVFSREYLGNALINSLMETFVTIGAYTHVYLALIGFFVSYIMTQLRFRKKGRITY